MRGISQDKRTGKWKAQRMVNGKRLYLGMYATAEEALLRYAAAAVTVSSAPEVAESEVRQSSKYVSFTPGLLETKQRNALHTLLDCLLEQKRHDKVKTDQLSTYERIASADIADMGVMELVLRIPYP